MVKIIDVWAPKGMIASCVAACNLSVATSIDGAKNLEETLRLEKIIKGEVSNVDKKAIRGRRAIRCRRI